MTAKPVLILQLRPEDITSDSEYGCILKYGHLPENRVHRIRIENTGIPTDLNALDYAAIIVGGSPFDISTPVTDKSAIQKRIEADFSRLFDQVIPEDIPFLGCCSGSGLLGSYLGANLSRKYGEPVGCATVTITAEGQADPLLEGFPDQITVLLGHKEACDAVPGGAVLLISGEDCPVQMFRVGNNVYATQFHPEGDPDEFCLRIDAYKNHGYFEPEETARLKLAVRQKPTPQAQDILRRFVNRYVLSTPQPA
jgi:GMP synthase (glutamine-hydrolysing)